MKRWSKMFTLRCVVKKYKTNINFPRGASYRKFHKVPCKVPSVRIGTIFWFQTDPVCFVCRAKYIFTLMFLTLKLPRKSYSTNAPDFISKIQFSLLFASILIRTLNVPKRKWIFHWTFCKSIRLSIGKKTKCTVSGVKSALNNVVILLFCECVATTLHLWHGCANKSTSRN